MDFGLKQCMSGSEIKYQRSNIKYQISGFGCWIEDPRALPPPVATSDQIQDPISDVGCWILDTGHRIRLLDTEYWSLITGYWLLATGYWLLDAANREHHDLIGKDPILNPISSIQYQMLDVG